MSYQININGEDKEIEILHREGNSLEATIDKRNYRLNLVEVQKGVFSVINEGTTFTIELVKTTPKKYDANSGFNRFQFEIVDAQTRYLRSVKGDAADESNTISTPMPGKIVKILVEEGQKVKAGSTVVIVSAMKMESEYKVVKDRIIKQVLVSEGDNIDGDQPLIILE